MSDKDRAFEAAMKAIFAGAEAAKGMEPIDTKIIEVGPGQISVTCTHSNMPLERTNAYGTFCLAEDCLCEKQSKEIAKAMGEFFPGLDDE